MEEQTQKLCVPTIATDGRHFVLKVAPTITPYIHTYIYPI